MSTNYYGADELSELFGDDQIVGDDEIIGDDDEPNEFSGRARGGTRVRGGLRVMQKQKNTLYKQPLPLPASASIAAGASSFVVVQPQRTIRVERLVVPRSIVDDFTVDAVNVGQEPQFVAEGAIPADVFAPDAVGVGLKGDTANVGNTITVRFTNVSAGAAIFRATILGTVLN